MITAIITARGGSTRVPRKNLANVCGLPLVAWSIIQAKCSLLIDKIYLTTDDDEIAAVGDKHDIEVIRRPVWDNGVTGGFAFYDAYQKIVKKGENPDSLLTILPTMCLRKPNHFDRLIEAHIQTGGLVTTGCPQKETFIYKNNVAFQDRFMTKDTNGFYFCHALLGDKFWNYSKMGGGDAIDTVANCVKVWQESPITDIEIDTKPVDTAKEWTFVPIEEWQTFDVDYPADLELVRVLMEHYICKGRGPEVYYEYAIGEELE